MEQISKNPESKLEGGENPKNFSEDEVKKLRDLADKTWEVMTWDLAKFCGTSEEVDMVHKAQDSMAEVMAMLDMPLDRFGNWNKKEPKPITSKSFSPDDMKKLRSDLEAIEEALEWDISASDEEELTMIRDARESLKALKDIL
ncbi:MAG: hypothetical protein A3B99_01805 [Candidatus Yanofskybacteria bacterium RIFCSPHIGHO2_02_FULL_44_12b]|uniref:Uncharacterized protein n=2 Tax=Candidatus Yanofskyibacteriota TaxID=1752733 RepID=A0A1F8GLX9_9BACT|nr:MAG: hypothetical protein UW79_C0002G0020 [Candidatus Yanofskybacteria bacterium GW2011_GWA2_44_9]OGN05278.1 MAG: hypothetical protein A2659_04985 [Candidatus Yanofskybacteria bacterium RIFCSPHIGHO2_01_FULL_44_24]OGN14977.1 MAG: hypothetical protein A3B99_01805 [Candidatus Yanofskybacteria bacterium RIFCSPHIGHO2_02_FULL_44_12b]OGN26415.1 MAG: hypothetical protein A2925_03515 [Candidatus Yanofskybacteria bacterium RIFCSPLOWO2_01_FULL_44_22]